MGSSSPPPLSVLDLRHPFTCALAVFALGYAAVMAALLRLYIILPDRVVRPSSRQSPAGPPPLSHSDPATTSPTRQRVRSRRPSAAAAAESPSKSSSAAPASTAAAAAAARKVPIRRSAPAKTLVVLGSGGHTKEMLTMLQGLDRGRYGPITFVRAASDTRSDGMVRAAGPSLQPDATLTVPRSRAVGQSWLTTPFTTLHALGASLWLVLRLRPDLVVCNGPGTCLPICLAAYALRFLGLLPVRVVFVESLCRVQSLSLTGRLLYYLADRFVVQWPGLVDRYPLAEYIGQLC